ncbi:MAG: SH3 domain-containing protein [Nocardioidaceae bacterium]|nr:SH3 domain-containing protein [Nocardioidaceae bacterium]NUS49836.1 SH3 domain-containing protein [Nocardioidaceae bacterium]
MSSGRHRQVAEHPLRRRLLKLVLPATAATVATGVVVGVSVAGGLGGADPSDLAADVHKPLRVNLGSSEVDPADSPYLSDRLGSFSRSAKRVTLQEKPEVKDREWMTTALNLWPTPEEKGEPIDVLKSGDQVSVTGVEQNGFAQILYDDQIRWVNADYLSDEKPKPPEPEPETEAPSPESPAGVSFAPCPDGSDTESGLTSSAVNMFRAVCNAFPELSSYGGYDAHGEHSSGQAVDFMISDSSTGQAVADWVRDHASELNVYDVIWAQHIWTPERASEGWRLMPDRGSDTANHYDHVHVSVN